MEDVHLRLKKAYVHPPTYFHNKDALCIFLVFQIIFSISPKIIVRTSHSYVNAYF